MGKSGENGFVLFARELHARHARQGLGTGRMSFAEFVREVASAAWNALVDADRLGWKERAKTAKAASRAAGVSQRAGRGGQSGGAGGGGGADEVEILERLPRKRSRDINRLSHRWEWRYGGGERSPLDTDYWLLTVQAFGAGMSGRRPEHLPAELCLLKFSLKAGVSQCICLPVHHLPAELLTEGEDWEYGVACTHGVAAVTNPAPNDDIAQLTTAAFHKLAKLFDRVKSAGKLQDRVLVFGGDYLSALGCLNYVTRLTDWASLRGVNWAEELICAEDWADVALRFIVPEADKRVLKAQAGQTASSEVSLCGALRALAASLAGMQRACRLHSILDGEDESRIGAYWERVYGRPGMVGPELTPRVGGYECAESLGRSVIALLRYWTAGSMDEGQDLPELEALGTGPERGPDLPHLNLVALPSNSESAGTAEVKEETTGAAAVYSRLLSPEPPPSLAASKRGFGRGLSTASVQGSRPGSLAGAPIVFGGGAKARTPVALPPQSAKTETKTEPGKPGMMSRSVQASVSVVSVSVGTQTEGGALIAPATASADPPATALLTSTPIQSDSDSEGPMMMGMGRGRVMNQTRSSTFPRLP